MRAESGQIAIRLAGQDYTLLAINGSAIREIRQSAKTIYGKWWLKAMAEDLPSLLAGQDIDRGSWVSLQVRKLDSSDIIEFDRVLMTRANWSRIVTTRPLGRTEAKHIVHELTKVPRLVGANSGGTHDVLRTLLPFFVGPDEPPRIVNVAKYRLRKDELPGKPDGYLSPGVSFSPWPAPSGATTNAKRFGESFDPEWHPPSDGFSDWHYCLVSRTPADKVYWYNRPVVVLMDSGCASATDVFLGAFAACKNMTLMGTPSSGMSGRMRSVELSAGFKASVSTMCSWRPSGQLYSSGISPDRFLEPLPTDWIGQTDSLLEAAAELLEQSDPK